MVTWSNIYTSYGNYILQQCTIFDTILCASMWLQNFSVLIEIDKILLYKKKKKSTTDNVSHRKIAVAGIRFQQQ